MNSNTSSAAALAEEQTLTRPELEQARTYLQQTRDGVLGATKGVSEAQWRFKPASDRWSIAQIVEHAIMVEERVLGPIRDQLTAAPAAPASYDRSVVDAIVINQFPNRLTKFQAPFHPTGQLSRSGAFDRLLKNYTHLTDYLESTPDLRHHALEAPPLKGVSKGAYQVMDGYQWILAAAAHTERHTKQILEVMAHPNFPET
jgi:hypothetical protein